jgi:hypothetical protein
MRPTTKPEANVQSYFGVAFFAGTATDDSSGSGGVGVDAAARTDSRVHDDGPNSHSAKTKAPTRIIAAPRWRRRSHSVT